MAMDFIERKVCPYGTYEEELQSCTDGTPPVIKVYARFPSEVREIIRSKTKEKGFSHWDDPLLVGIDEDAKNEYGV